jgi:hypothetical protein
MQVICEKHQKICICLWQRRHNFYNSNASAAVLIQLSYLSHASDREAMYNRSYATSRDQKIQNPGDDLPLHFFRRCDFSTH